MRKMGRKRIFMALLLIALLLPVTAALGEPLGFGFVNAKDVALRRGVGGKILVRLPVDTTVWIKDVQTDAKGVTWYQVNAGLNVDYTNCDYAGWMKAEFIDAGDRVWHDVTSVEAKSFGMIVLRSDGSTETAGRSIVAMDGSRWVQPRRWADGYRNVRQVGTVHGNTYWLLTADGSLVTSLGSAGQLSGRKVRLLTSDDVIYGLSAENDFVSWVPENPLTWIQPGQAPGSEALSHVVQVEETLGEVLFLKEDGSLYVASFNRSESGMADSDWDQWTDLRRVLAAYFNIREQEANVEAFVGVRRDGSLLAKPEELRTLIGGWTGMADVRLAPYFIIGLRQDGTAVSLGLHGRTPPDVSSWQNVTAIACGNDYCVGLRADGTLVFAGEHIFMNEGHNRK